MTRVAVVGGAGRMGQVLAVGLDARDDVTVVALVDVVEPATVVGRWCRQITDLDPDAVDVVVDFSTPATTRAVLAWALAAGVAVVVGTTGLAPDEFNQIDADARAAGGHVVVAPNFSMGAVLAERFAAMAAPYFPTVEVIELHHDRKVDAPSGTSLAVARAIAASRAAAGSPPIADPTERATLPGSRGSDAGGGVRVHSVRLSGLVAHQEIIFGGPGEGLTIRHDSYDRESYVAGVALAVAHVRGHPGLTLGLGALL